MYSSVLHDPYAGSTPSQRLAAAARAMRRAKIAAAAKVDTPITCPSASQRVLPVREVRQLAAPVSFGDWFCRQEHLNPLPKKTWFSIESEIDAPAPKISVKDIQRIVAKYYRVTVNDLTCGRRQAYLMRPRQVAIYLARNLTPCSLPEIGRRFGHRDHTSALHAVNKIKSLLPLDAQLSAEIAALSVMIVGVQG
jgi:hypothetical protein